jgi:hypothetical protein
MLNVQFLCVMKSMSGNDYLSPLAGRYVLTVVLLCAALSAWGAPYAAGASPSCALPHHPVASEDAAVDAVIKAVDVAQLLRPRRLSMQCVEFISSQNADEPRYSVVLREKHDAQCGGDPNFAPRVFTVNVASNGRMTTDAYDVADGRDQPLRCLSSRANKPGDVVYDFYRWYLAQDRAEHDPIFNERKQMSHYVSRTLLRLADTKKWHNNRDYFTKAQSFDPAWINTIVPESTHMHGSEATVYLNLGVRVTNAQISKMAVTLRK